MSSPGAWIAVAALTAGLAILPAAPAAAYIDPGTGSYVFQMIAALLITAGFALKTFWGRIRAALSNLAGRRGGDGKPRS